jgi:hypothetical protein
MRTRRALGITLEEAKVVQLEMQRQQALLQSETAALTAQRNAVLEATKKDSAALNAQTAQQISEAQAAELERLRSARAFRVTAVVLGVLGMAGSVGAVMWLNSQQKAQ